MIIGPLATFNRLILKMEIKMAENSEGPSAAIVNAHGRLPQWMKKDIVSFIILCQNSSYGGYVYSGNQVIGWLKTHNLRSIRTSSLNRYLPEDDGCIYIHRDGVSTTEEPLIFIPSDHGFYFSFLTWLCDKLKISGDPWTRGSKNIRIKSDFTEGGEKQLEMSFERFEEEVTLITKGKCSVEALLSLLYEISDFYYINCMLSLKDIERELVEYSRVNMDVDTSHVLKFDLSEDDDGMMCLNFASDMASRYIFKKYSRFSVEDPMVGLEASSCLEVNNHGIIAMMEGDVRICSPSYQHLTSFAVGGFRSVWGEEC